jgi:hypothetical protein
MLGLGLGIVGAIAAGGAHAIDNSALEKTEFREHKATYGVVYRLPAQVTDILDQKINPVLRERLVKLGLADEARTFNLRTIRILRWFTA